MEKSKNDIAKECKRCYYDEKCYVSRRSSGLGLACIRSGASHS